MPAKKKKPTILTDEEMLKLQFEAEKEKRRQAEEQLVLAENARLDLEQKIIAERKKLVSHRYAEVKRLNEKEREKRVNFMNELKDKFGIPREEGLGYNPDTGEIIRDTKGAN